MTVLFIDREACRCSPMEATVMVFQCAVSVALSSRYVIFEAFVICNYEILFLLQLFCFLKWIGRSPAIHEERKE
jgi:hypothetical protein